MGVVFLVILVIILCSYLISRAVYLKQVRNDYKTPMLTAVLVFVLSAAVLTGGILLLIVNTLNFSRH